MDIRDFQLAAAPPEFLDDPYPWYAALREHDPVHEMDSGVLLTRYDDALAVYRDPHASSDKKVEFKPKFGDSPLYEHHTTSLVFNDAPYHTRVRRLMTGALNQRAIARMEQQVGVLVEKLLDELQEKESPDLIADFAARIPVEVIGNLLDIPHAERGPLRAWSIAILSGLEPRLTPAMHARGNAAVREFASYLQGLIEQRTKRPGDPDADVLTRLIQGDGEQLSGAELQHNCIFLLNAGHETTTNLIGNGVFLLFRFPREKEILLKNPNLVPSAIEEMLRYEGPIQLNNRRLTAPMALGGRRLPQGTLITIGIGAANRDPRQFPEAERFDVARRPNRHLAFGQGEHACAGMNVARMEGRIALSRLLERFPGIEPNGSPVRDRRVRFRGFRALPVRVIGT